MKVELPVLVKDPEVADIKGVEQTETFVIDDDEEVFLDGPVTRRVAVLDFDPQSGALLPGARFAAPAEPGGKGSYALPHGERLDDPAFMQACTFGGVCKTIAMFEEPDALGRRVRWAFAGDQLLVVPRAGEWANAFYERESRSLQFFHFTPGHGGASVYTCHSQDIIAHETAHAVIDGVAPDLYHAASPQGLAIHESIADLATLITAFRSRKLAARVLARTGGSIDRPSAFTTIAEQFADALQPNRHGLRNLSNELTLRDAQLDRSDPHALSEVLSGALYRVMVRIYDELRRAAPETIGRGRYAEQAEVEQWKASDDPSAQLAAASPGQSAGRALFIASERFKRTVLRALDYLPPGEVGFADFGRALLASDQASHPESGAQRDFLVEEFVHRGIVDVPPALAVQTNRVVDAVSQLDLDELLRSDWLAYRFADAQRALLGIPADLPFEVRPRLDVTKKYYHRGDEAEFVRECLLKVSWQEVEAADVGASLPARRRIVRGTTLAIDWDTHQVRAIVTGGRSDADRQSRDAFVRRLVAADQLRLGAEALRPDGRPRRGVVMGDVVDGTLRLRATARALHILSPR